MRFYTKYVLWPWVVEGEENIQITILRGIHLSGGYGKVAAFRIKIILKVFKLASLNSVRVGREIYHTCNSSR